MPDEVIKCEPKQYSGIPAMVQKRTQEIEAQHGRKIHLTHMRRVEDGIQVTWEFDE